MLVRKVSQSRPDPRELNELYYRAARTADELGDYDRALRHYEAAYNIDSTYLPTLIGRADLLFKMSDWDGAGKIYQTILVQHRDSQPEAEVVRIYNRMGMVRQNLGERKKALNMFEKALEIDPNHRRRSSQAVIEMQLANNDWEAVIQCQAGAAPRRDGEEKVQAQLDEMAEMYADKPAAVPEGHSERTSRRSRSSATDHVTLHKVLELYTKTEQWKKASRPSDGSSSWSTTPSVKRQVLPTRRASSTRDELKSTDEAIDQFNLALDSYFAKPAKIPSATVPASS
jgi:tetratricopeptide (TPR) repeat protein